MKKLGFLIERPGLFILGFSKTYDECLPYISYIDSSTLV